MPMTIHANWQDRSLLLWADNRADVAALRDAVGQLCTDDGLLSSVAQAQTLRLWLPCDNGQPLPALATAGAAATLCATDVPALQFSAAEAMDLLLALPQPLPDQVGESVDYWLRLARFVMDSIRLERFYPIARRSNAHHEAYWRLHVTPPELGALERFAAALPPVCLAIADDESTALERIESFLAATADALIRRAASTDSFFARPQTESQAPAAPPEVRFLAGLLADAPAIPGSAYENDALVDQVQMWTSKLTGAPPTTGWQLGMELSEPPEDAPDGAPWRLDCQLIPLGDDDAKPIDADKIWTDASPLSALGRQQPELRAALISELARAAESCPPILRITSAPSPAFVELSTAEAQQFLRQWSAELKAKGFSIELPSWAEEVDRRLSLVMALRPLEASGDLSDFAGGGGTGSRRGGGAFEPGVARMGLDSVLAFDWRVSVGGLELSPDEFDLLVRRQQPLVRVAGRWVEIEADAAAMAEEFIRRNRTGQTTLGEAFRTAFATNAARGEAGAAAPGGTKAAPAVVLSGVSWVKDLLEQLPAMRAPDVAQPNNFHGTLRPYQLRGLQWLAFLDRLGIGGCLADDMGLGKTIQLIALLQHERVNGSNGSNGNGQPHPHRGPTLLFAPTSVVGNWVKELERFAPEMKVLLHHGPQRLKGESFIRSAANHDVVITSYALAHRDLDVLNKVPWHRIALDEAQKIKNPSAASSIAIRSLHAPRRVALTGTPVENHLSELWSIMDVLNPGVLGSAKDFRERFAVPIEKLLDKDRGDHLRKMIRPFVLRRTKSDPAIAGDLPDKIEMKVFCNLTVEQAAMYERATAEMLAAIDAATGIRRRGLILAVLTRLKQICDHPALLEDNTGEAAAAAQLDRRSGKCERLIDMLEEVIDEGESALVFTQYAQMGKLLQRMLSQRLRCPVSFLHGGTPQKQRDEMVQKFQSGGPPGVFILSLRAGGLGLNLTAASHVFHFDRWWNPAVENQATDRDHRIGQQRREQVHKFIAMGTVEERIDKLLTEKTQLAESIVGTGEEWLTELSTQDLKEYLQLAEQAVSEF
jgi:superfamily II DNA or RNA helicase